MNQLPSLYNVVKVAGRGRGKKLGIPTLNFSIPKTIREPHGIYAGWVHANSEKYSAAIHFGPRPVFAESDPSLEAYVLNGTISQDTANFKLELVSFIREIRNFPSTEDMVAQIKKDVLAIKKILKLNP